jgi:hypothetical protein
MFSHIHWDYICSVLNDPKIRLLIVASELPLVDDNHSNILKCIHHDSQQYSRCRSWWAFVPLEQQRYHGHE